MDFCVEGMALPWPYEVAPGSKRLVRRYWARGLTWDWALKTSTWWVKRASRITAKDSSKTVLVMVQGMGGESIAYQGGYRFHGYSPLFVVIISQVMDCHVILTSKALDINTRDSCSELEAGALSSDQGLDDDGVLSMRHCARFG